MQQLNGGFKRFQSGNKKPRNGAFRGVSLNGLEVTACMCQAIEYPLFSSYLAFSRQGSGKDFGMF